MKKVRMNIFHSRFILFNLKIFGEIVTPNFVSQIKSFLDCALASDHNLLYSELDFNNPFLIFLPPFYFHHLVGYSI